MDEQNRSPEPGVVVGVDGSGAALSAVRWAAAEAQRCRVPLRIVHAAPYALGSALGNGAPPPFWGWPGRWPTRPRPGVPVYTECVLEHPARVLAAVAESARLLVVGMDGNPLEDVLGRSVALDMCATASCPVVVVRGRHGPAPVDGPVVLGLQDVGGDAPAITSAFADADRAGTSLVVVHVMTRPDVVLDTVAGHPESARAMAEEDIETALAPWRSGRPCVPVEVRVVGGSPTRRLLEAAASPRLLVVGAHTRGSGTRLLLLGSTSRAIVRHIPCPVLVVRRDTHVIDPEVSHEPVTATAPASWALRPHDRGELW